MGGVRREGAGGGAGRRAGVLGKQQVTQHKGVPHHTTPHHTHHKHTHLPMSNVSVGFTVAIEWNSDDVHSVLT